MITRTISQKAAMAMSIFTIAIFLCSMNVKAQYFPFTEGRLYKRPSLPEIFWVVYRQFHHVQSIETYNGLFGPSPVLYFLADNYVFQTVDIGSPINASTCITHDLSTCKRYIRFNGQYYYITSIDAFYSYSLSEHYIVYRYGLDLPVASCELPASGYCRW